MTNALDRLNHLADRWTPRIVVSVIAAAFILNMSPQGSTTELNLSYLLTKSHLSCYIRHTNTPCVSANKTSKVMSRKITTADAAKILNISIRAVQGLLQRGTIKGEKFLRDWMVDEESVYDYKRLKEEKQSKQSNP